MLLCHIDVSLSSFLSLKAMRKCPRVRIKKKKSILKVLKNFKEKKKAQTWPFCQYQTGRASILWESDRKMDPKPGRLTAVGKEMRP